MFEPLKTTGCLLLLSLQLLFPHPEQNLEALCLPHHQSITAIYSYPGYTLQYSEEFEQANWVAYVLTKNEVLGSSATRTDKFLPDPFILTGSATDADYRKSGYDRGHLAPAADMKWSPEAMKACFYYSNMSPQEPSFNRGIWSSLEAMVRYWAVENGSVLVVTGPVLNSPDFPRIGPNAVAVPDMYFKVILDYQKPEIKAIGFVLPNQKGTLPLESYACTVDYVEEVTGLNFFPDLPDQEETQLEGAYLLSLWPFIEFSRHRNP